MSAMNYITVEGLAELKQALSGISEKSKVGSQVTQVDYIFFGLAEQRSLIRVGRVGSFFYISYYDLQGRPVTIGIKEVIAQFLRDKHGNQGRFEDVSGKEVLERNAISFLETDGECGRVVLGAGVATLTHARQQLEQAAAATQRTQKPVVKAGKHFGFFHQVEAEQLQAAAVDEVRITPDQSPKK